MPICFVVLALALTCCFDGAAPTPTPPTDYVQANRQSKVDLLFVIDNTSSMAPVQAELQNRIGDFFGAFENQAADFVYPDLHIGVVTSDYGAGPVADGDCDASPGGQKGILQTGTGCTQPSGRFIDYAFGSTGAISNLPNNDNSVANLTSTFTCMSNVGTRGCRFKHPLEAAYAALRNTVENRGFLRDDALLVVVFVTNGDDGSAPPSTDLYLRNATQYGTFDAYRQTLGGIACGSPLALAPDAPSNGPLSCVPAPATLAKEYDVLRYIDFFTKPASQGGVKYNPQMVNLVAIDGSVAPFETLFAVADSNPLVQCDTAGPDCIVQLQHSCQNQALPAFFGAPPIRLQTVIDSVSHNLTSSICGDDPSQPPSFANALGGVSHLIAQQLSATCVPGALADAAHPNCSVFDVDPYTDGTERLTTVPNCNDVGGRLPCWTLVVQSDQIAQCPSFCTDAGVRMPATFIDIQRGSTAQPHNTGISCEVLSGSYVCGPIGL